MRLEIRDLRLVVTLAGARSVTEAARRLNVTQPALSKHLRLLEERIGAPLFDRSPARFAPTVTGEALLRHAHDVVGRVSITETELQQLREVPRRILRVCTDCYTGYHWLPRAISCYTSQHPGTDVEIAFEATRQPLKLLRAGTIDIALLTRAVPRRGLAVTPLFTDEYVGVVSPSHRLAKRGFIEARDLVEERVLLLSPPETSTVMRWFVRPARVKPKHVADVQLIGALAALAENGYGIGITPNWTIAPELRAGRLVAIRLGRQGFRRTWSATTPIAHARDQGVRDFLHVVATTVPGLGDVPRPAD